MSDSREMSELEWLAREVSEWGEPTLTHATVIDLTNEKRVAYMDSALSCSITRPQWQAERKRLGLDESPVEWVGDLPPVGEYCSAAWLEPPDGGSMIPEPVLVKGYFSTGAGKQVWLCNEDGQDFVLFVSDCTFQPLRTKEKREREEIIADLSEHLDGIESGLVKPREMALYLFNEGYRKQEPQS